MKFEKRPLSISEHISLLKERGLIISNEDRCRKYLKHIGYYRLSAYFLPYQINYEHLFKRGSSFDNVLNLYIFDRKLRVLFLDVIERIEISLRAQLIDAFCHTYGTHGYIDKESFKPSYNHEWLVRKISNDIKKSHEPFIQHYLETYCSPELPPFWMVAQILSFKELSILIENIIDESILDDMALSLNIHKPVFLSWLKSLSQLRNICAHHGRLWNRVFGIKPKTVKKPINSWKGLSFTSFEVNALNDKKVIIDPSASLFGHLVIVWYWVNKISTTSSWFSKFEELVEYHSVNYQLMGFYPDWEKSEFWVNP